MVLLSAPNLLKILTLKNFPLYELMGVVQHSYLDIHLKLHTCHPSPTFHQDKNTQSHTDEYMAKIPVGSCRMFVDKQFHRSGILCHLCMLELVVGLWGYQ